MPFLSSLLHKPVKDAKGEDVGKAADIVVSAMEKPYPLTRALVVTTPQGEMPVPWKQIDTLDAEIVLKAGLRVIEQYDKQERDIQLVADVLDMQLIDGQNAMVSRVNDVELAPTNGAYRVVGVEIGVHSFLRRLGIGPIIKNIGLRSHGFIPWEAIDVGKSDTSGIRLKVPKDVITRLHPQDVSEMAQLFEQMPADDAADLLMRMQPDDAADVLERMPTDKAEAIFEQMPSTQAREIRGLLEYSKSV
ncbi:MAG: magnesium transporter MgtE N-terminal domain-containing protein [Halobacteriota archaeon]